MSWCEPLSFGQKEKHIIERRAAHGKAFDFDLCIFQTLQNMLEGGGTIAGGNRDDPLFGIGLQLRTIDGLLR